MLFTILALFSTVFALVCMAYFMLGSLPLLVLNHDTPLDSRFIRGLFNVYYRALPIVAGFGAVSYALAGKPGFAAEMAAIGVLTLVARRFFLAKMDAVRATMTATDADAIARFRRLHIAGMVLNAAQLLTLALSLTLLRL
ncbi:hypothetical protein GCM10027034_40050 [Ramlibacter solisilvae]|uniref:DUF4149 domain-containing protein n=1 Tax=Ramlibacter tataouinensis TaxID=94132 RepID=A0A127JU50_9BURK|nr:hypothetical protein [Ramlibacter tataouinensis]AMO23490.1 hypothetical protein UC35_12000 [Ramlibacter tataouinensis]